MKLPKRKWLSVDDLIGRWGCEICDITHLVIAREISLCVDWWLINESKEYPYEDILFAFYDEGFSFDNDISKSPYYKEYAVCKGVNFRSSVAFIYEKISEDEMDLKTELQIPNLLCSPITARLFELDYDYVCTSSDVVQLPVSSNTANLEPIGSLDYCKTALLQNLFSASSLLEKRIRYLEIPKRDLFVLMTDIERIESLSDSGKLNDPITEPISFEEENTPDNLYLAHSVFKEVWEKLPSDMNNPSIKQLKEYLAKKGISNKTTISAIIKVSKPDNITFGGHPKADKKPWDIEKY